MPGPRTAEGQPYRQGSRRLGSFAVAVREGGLWLADHGPVASISQAPGEMPLARWGADGRVVLQGRQGGASMEIPLNPA